MDQLILVLALLQEPRQHRAVPPGGRLAPPPASTAAPAAAPVRKLPEHQPAWSRAQQMEFEAALRAPEVRN